MGEKSSAESSSFFGEKKSFAESSRFFWGEKVLCGFVESRKSDPRDEQPKSESWDLSSEKTGRRNCPRIRRNFFWETKSSADLLSLAADLSSFFWRQSPPQICRNWLRIRQVFVGRKSASRIHSRKSDPRDQQSESRGLKSEIHGGREHSRKNRKRFVGEICTTWKPSFFGSCGETGTSCIFFFYASHATAHTAPRADLAFRVRFRQDSHHERAQKATDTPSQLPKVMQRGIRRRTPWPVLAFPENLYFFPQQTFALRTSLPWAWGTSCARAAWKGYRDAQARAVITRAVYAGKLPRCATLIADSIS